MSTKVEPYIIPLIQCYKCLLFGHIQIQCRRKKRCGQCTQVHEELTKNDDHSHGVCQIAIKYLHWGNSAHRSTNKKCSQFERRKQIQGIKI